MSEDPCIYADNKRLDDLLQKSNGVVGFGDFLLFVEVFG
jgi:hypothetical protein